jgi:hypothetical protein
MKCMVVGIKDIARPAIFTHSLAYEAPHDALEHVLGELGCGLDAKLAGSTALLALGRSSKVGREKHDSYDRQCSLYGR